MSSIPVFDISNPLGGLLDQAVAMGYVNEKRTTTKGAISSFDDNIEHAVSLEIDIDPTLDGVSGVNVVRTGKNLFNPSTVFTATGSYMYAKSIFPKNTNLICKFVDKDPTVDISGIYFGFYDDTYTSGSASSGHFRWLINNGNVQTNMTNTASSDTSVLCNSLFAFPKDENTLDILLDRFDIQIEIGTDSTDYVEYDGNTSTISLGSTIYGGSVTVDEEGACELTETYNHGTLKSNAPNFTESISTNFTTYYAKISTIFTDIQTTGYAKGLCNQFTFTDSPGAADVNVAYVQSGYLNIRVESGTYADAAAFKDWVIANGIELTYEKAESTNTDLTDITPIETLEGENNIWADTGDIEVGYYYQLYQPI